MVVAGALEVAAVIGGGNGFVADHVILCIWGA